MNDSHEPGEGGRAKPHGLVRPYVLSSDGSARKRPVQRETTESLTRGHQSAFDWTGDLASRRPRDARSESTRPAAPTRPRPATVPLPSRPSAGSHRALRRGARASQAIWLGSPRVLTERRWLAAIVGVAGLAIVCGMILLLSRAPSKPLAGACRTAGCHHGAGPFGGTEPPAAHRVIPRSHPTATPSTARPSPSPTPSATPTASPTRPPVQVGYAVVRQHPHTFQGQFTIVNNGSTAINGWELVVVLPGDDIRSVSDGAFHTVGDTLYIDPFPAQRSIAPGASLIENFIAHGSTTTLTSCTFNGSAC